MTRTRKKFHRPSAHFRILAIFALLWLGACASLPPPVGSMSQAESLLQAAERADAQTYAPLELGFARDKLDKARLAMLEEDYEMAAALAEESQVNSELARVKAELGSLREQIKAATDENELQRARLLDATSAGDLP